MSVTTLQSDPRVDGGRSGSVPRASRRRAAAHEDLGGVHYERLHRSASAGCSLRRFRLTHCLLGPPVAITQRASPYVLLLFLSFFFYSP